MKINHLATLVRKAWVTTTKTMFRNPFGILFPKKNSGCPAMQTDVATGVTLFSGWVQCYNHLYCRFLPILGEKIATFLEHQF
jgi:hypothetical protein